MTNTETNPTSETTPVAQPAGKAPLINCHAHVFTGDHVAPFLARTILPRPLHALLYIPMMLWLVRWWYNGPARLPYGAFGRKFTRLLYNIRIMLVRSFLLSTFSMVLTVYAILLVYNWFPTASFWPFTWVNRLITQLDKWLPGFLNISAGLQAVVLFFIVLLYPMGRKALLFVIKQLWAGFKKLPGAQSKEMLARYWNIVRFARYKAQETGFEKLDKQYPVNSGFVLLPMDMDFMKAGTPPKPYLEQMAGLLTVKQLHPKRALPMIFAHPERLRQSSYFSYTAANGTVTLRDCFVKTYIETHGFRGIKLYPALGYYPFDEALLPLWKYAADNQIPLMSHCVRGPMYYRGRKKKEWDTHPVFRQVYDKGDYMPLLLPQMGNSAFSANFTHPMNYLCLLDETLLRRVVANASQEVKDLFGYTNPETALQHNLKHLKLCLAHFGGADEWARYFEQDRFNLSNQLVQYPEHGIHFLNNKNGVATPGNEEKLWRYTDWYSIICSLMLQYENVYADISYILHDAGEVLPLLIQTLRNPKLGERVLYGTDFFVVRNHKSDKNMYSDMMGGLDVADFDRIARTNPREYLKTVIHGPLAL